MQRWTSRLRVLLGGQEPASSCQAGADASPEAEAALDALVEERAPGGDDAYLHWVRESGAWQLRGTVLPPTRTG